MFGIAWRLYRLFGAVNGIESHSKLVKHSLQLYTSAVSDIHLAFSRIPRHIRARSGKHSMGPEHLSTERYEGATIRLITEPRCVIAVEKFKCFQNATHVEITLL